MAPHAEPRAQPPLSDRINRLAAIAGASSPFLVAMLLVVMTPLSWNYLERIGWSPVHRTPTEWPSVMATGPVGWMWAPGMALAGTLGLGLGVVVWRTAGTSVARVAALALIGMSAALALVGSPADAPNASETFHGDLHNFAYPFIPICAIVAAIALATENRDMRRNDRLPRSRLWPVLLLAAFATTNVDAIAQLARYVAFAVLLAWVLAVALGVAARGIARPIKSSPGRSRPAAG